MREPINILLTPWPGYQGSKNANVSRNNLDYHGQIINKYSMSISLFPLFIFTDSSCLQETKFYKDFEEYWNSKISYLREIYEKSLFKIDIKKQKAQKLVHCGKTFSKSFPFNRQFCFEHKFSLCHYCCPEEETFNNFGSKLFFHVMWCDLKTLCSFPICCKVTIMVIRDIKSKNKIATNCNNPFLKV